MYIEYSIYVYQIYINMYIYISDATVWKFESRFGFRFFSTRNFGFGFWFAITTTKFGKRMRKLFFKKLVFVSTQQNTRLKMIFFINWLPVVA